jgi:phage terminase large subunit-like protein
MLEFPLGKHDDTVDAAAYIPQILRKPGRAKAKGYDRAYVPVNKVTGY